MKFLRDLTGYRTREERAAQRAARERVVQEMPDMSSLGETRVLASFATKAGKDLLLATGWAGLGALLYHLAQSDLPLWAVRLCLVGLLLTVPMVLGNLLTGSIQASRAMCTRFDWVAFEEMSGLPQAPAK